MAKLEKNLLPPSRVRIANRYDFDSLNVGESLTFTKDDVTDFQYVRNAASAYGLRHGKRLRCGTLPDGRLQVYRDHDPAIPVQRRVRVGINAATPPDAIAAPAIDAIPNRTDLPTADEFKSHLKTFAEGQTQFVDEKYADAYGVMAAWTRELAKESGKNYFGIVSQTGPMQIGLMPGAYTTKPMFFTNDETEIRHNEDAETNVTT